MNGWTLAAIVLAAALLLVGREWLRLRALQRQRGFLRRWPVPKAGVEALGGRFAAGEFGATLAAEVVFLGRANLRVPGGTSDTESWILAVVAKDARRLFEFGTCTGKTSYLWARNQPPGGTVTTLTLGPGQAAAYVAADGDDPTAEAYAKAESGFSRFLYSGTEVASRIEQLYGDSKQFDEGPWLGTCDVVFVDGSHAYSYVVNDSAKALRMVRPGGLVLWHDYSPECPGVFRALNELSVRYPLSHLQGTTLVAYRCPETTAPR